MKPIIKIAIFTIIFTVVFCILRIKGEYFGYNIDVLIADINGLAYLYSTIVFIFAIFAGFVILSEAERWSKLASAVRGEVGELNELRLWAEYLPEGIKSEFNQAINQYLKAIIGEGWQVESTGKKSEKVEESLKLLHNGIYKVSKEAPHLMTEIFSAFSDLIKYRDERIHHTSFHLPKILKNTLIFSGVLLVVLSFLIGVHNFWLDYIFVLGISVLVYATYLVIYDLDYPLQEGGWYITTKGYEELLELNTKK
jgi:hypothetical protein